MRKKMMNVVRGCKEELKKFWCDEEGMGSVELILILVVLVGLVLIFRTQVTNIVENAFKQISTDEKNINKGNSIKNGVQTR